MGLCRYRPALAIAEEYGQELFEAVYLPDFDSLSEACFRNLIVYPHGYADCKEIIIQDGQNTKVTGLKQVLSALRENRDFQGKFIVFTHGNSSNNLGKLVWANEFAEGQEVPGGSVWVGEGSDTAKFCLGSVEIFQQALIFLSWKTCVTCRGHHSICARN
jgi:hypothetical protein